MRIRTMSWQATFVVALCSRAVQAQAPGAREGDRAGSPPHADPVVTRFRASVDSVLAQPEFRNAQWGVLVVDAAHGDTLYSHNAEKLFVPASNEKLITAAVALAALGPDFQFTTRVAATGRRRENTWYGDLVVFGSGDPSFSDHVRGDAMVPLREMADSLRARGITRFDGQLRRGPSIFTDAPIGFGWGWDDLSATFGAPVGDLMFNEAFAPVRIDIDGVFDTTAVRNQKHRNFLDAFDTALNERGVRIALSWSWPALTLPADKLTTIFEYRSPPLRELLSHFTKPSQNQIGEVLLKTLGLRAAGSGTADSGAAVVARQLLAWGADSGGFVVHDGSGLSRHDLLSPETLVRVLDAARKDSTFDVFYKALPIAGVDGTLENRMHGTAAAGNVHAKTGSMDRVRALSGYVTTADGRMLEFSLMANAWTVTGAEVDSTIDRIVARLAALRLGT